MTEITMVAYQLLATNYEQRRRHWLQENDRVAMKKSS